MKTIKPRSKLLVNTKKNKYKIFVGTAMTGLLRSEWVLARYCQIIPCNWANVDCYQWLDTFAPLGYSVANAQNLICKGFVESKSEWLFLLEHDVVIPPDCFMQLNDYIRKETVPVVSGLYFTRSRPAEPMIYRGRGNSYVTDWKKGDKVWADGVPTGCLLIHGSIINKMWEESKEYMAGNVQTREVFKTPQDIWFDPDKNMWHKQSGTSDLHWCTRVMKEKFFEKAGWKKYQKKKYPFLVDTKLFCKHIGMDGKQYP